MVRVEDAGTPMRNAEPVRDHSRIGSTVEAWVTFDHQVFRVIRFIDHGNIEREYALNSAVVEPVGHGFHTIPGFVGGREAVALMYWSIEYLLGSGQPRVSFAIYLVLQVEEDIRGHLLLYLNRSVRGKTRQGLAQFDFIGTAVDANAGYGDRGLQIAGECNIVDLLVPDPTDIVEALCVRGRDMKGLGQRHEVVLGVDVVNSQKPIIIRTRRMFVGTEIEHRNTMPGVLTQSPMIQVPDNLIRTVQTYASIVFADKGPFGFQIGVELDQVPGSGHAQGSTRVQMVAGYAIGCATHDVVVENAGSEVGQHRRVGC